jgi:hypothetical protein
VFTLLTKDGHQYSPVPLRIKVTKNSKTEHIDSVYTKGNRCIALNTEGRAYMWGDLSYGISMDQGVEQSDLPRYSRTFQNYNFSDVALTDDTGIGISRSVLLTFSFADSNTND